MRQIQHEDRIVIISCHYPVSAVLLSRFVMGKRRIAVMRQRGHLDPTIWPPSDGAAQVPVEQGGWIFCRGQQAGFVVAPNIADRIADGQAGNRL